MTARLAAWTLAAGLLLVPRPSAAQGFLGQGGLDHARARAERLWEDAVDEVSERAAELRPDIGWRRTLLPYLGAVLYPLARRILAIENRDHLRPLNERERVAARLAFEAQGEASGLPAADVAALLGRMRIRYDAPQRIPWVEVQKMKRYCSRFADTAWVARARQGLREATRGAVDLGLCELLDWADRTGLLEQLPEIEGSAAQAVGAEVYVAGPEGEEGASRFEVLVHESWHVRQWWTAPTHPDVAWLRRLVGRRGLRTHAARDMAMGFRYFQAHVEAGNDYRSNALEAEAYDEAGRRVRAAGAAD